VGKNRSSVSFACQKKTTKWGGSQKPGTRVIEGVNYDIVKDPYLLKGLKVAWTQIKVKI
jgi:hypothetical protein